jgi:hypothetical protein
VGFKVGEVFVAIAPDTKGFSSQARSELNPLVGELAKLFHIKVKPDMSEFDTALAGAKKTIGTVAGVAGVGFGLMEVKNFVAETLTLGQAAEVTDRKVKIMFGDSADTVVAWSKNSITAMGLTHTEALNMAASYAQMLEGFGLSNRMAADLTPALAKRAVDLASTSGVAVDDVTTALDSAIRGRANRLKEFGVVIDETTLKAKAVEMGLTKGNVDPEKVAAAHDKLTAAQRDYQNTAARAKDPAIVAKATNAVTLAYGNQQVALQKHGATSAAYLAATDTLLTAQSSLANVQRTQGDSAGVLAAKQDALTKAQTDYNDAVQGTNDALTLDARAQAMVALFMEDSTKAADKYGETSTDKINSARKAWEQAKEDFGVAILPDFTRFAVSFTDWVSTHQQDIEHFAQNVAEGFHKAADFLQFILDHGEFFRDLLVVVAALKGVEFLRNLTKPATDVVKKVTGATKAMSTMTVGEMTVGTLIAKTSIGGPGAVPAVATTAAGEGVVVAESAAVGWGAKIAAGLGAAMKLGGAIAIGAMIGDAISQAIGGPSASEGINALQHRLSNDGTVDGKGTATSLAQWARDQTSGLSLPGGWGDVVGKVMGIGGGHGDVQQKLQDALGSKPISDAAVSGDAQGLSDVAQEAAKHHWTRQAQEYDDLSRLVQSGQITTAAQVKAFLTSGATYAGFLKSTLDAAKAQLTVALPGGSADIGATVVAQYRQTLNRNPEQQGFDFWTAYLRAHPGEQFPAAFTASANMSGGGEIGIPRVQPDFTKPVMPVEAKTSLDTIIGWLGTIASKVAAQAPSVSAPVTIHAGATDVVDPGTAVTRALWHATYDGRGVLPSSAGYRADEQATGGK